MTNLFDIQGQLALITGSTRGLAMPWHAGWPNRVPM